MTTPAVFTTSPRHPVRWFVTTMLGVAAMLVVIGWSGMFNPRLSAVGSSSSLERGEPGAVVLFIENDGRVPFRIVEASPLGAEVTGASLVLPVDLPGGEQREVGLRLTVRCQSSFSGPSGVRLRVRTSLGVHRDVDVTDDFLHQCR